MRVLSAEEVRRSLADFRHLLQDAVEDGATTLLASFDQDRIVGAIQIARETRPNGNHRAELMKLFVLRSHRRHGRARALLQAAVTEAKRLGLSLLVMDTRKGGDAERLCQSLGFHRYGEVPLYARSTNGQLHTTVFFYVPLDR